MDFERAGRSFETRFRCVFGIIAPVALIATLYVRFSPLEFSMPDYGLDPSWRAVLGEASAHGWRFGRDIIFTGGPLSAIYTRWFQIDRLGIYFAAYFVLIVTFAALVTIVAWRSRRLAAVFPVTLGIILCSFRDHIFVAYPLITSLVILSPRQGTLHKTAVAFGVFCCALLTLVKFPVAPMALIAFILCDSAALIHRRLPLYTGTYVVLCFCLFALSDGPESFLPFVLSSFDMALGYSEAMAIDRAQTEIIAFVVTAVLLLAAFAVMEAQSVRHSGTSRSIATVRWLVVAVYLFIMFKEGFVRHDEHSLLAWPALVLAALVYPLSFRVASRIPTHVSLAIAIWSIAAFVIVIHSLSPLASVLSPLASIPADAERQFTLIAGFLSHPEKQVAEWQRAKEEAWATVRGLQELPRISGSVDVIPSIQSSILAYGLDYRPRYSFQEYLTFTRNLIEANRRSLLDHGPEFLLFQPGAIDGRFPVPEGPLWPEILANYAPVSDDGTLLLLRRRGSSLGNLLDAEASQTVYFGDRVPIPEGPQFMRVKIKKSLYGTLVSLLFHPPLIWMRVALADGTEWRNRIVPAIAGEGFLVSPTIVTPHDFWLLALGRTDLTLPPIKWITFESSGVGQYAYAPQLKISFSSLSLDTLERASAPEW